MKEQDQVDRGGVQPLSGFAPADADGEIDAPFALPAHLSYADMAPLADAVLIERAQRLARRTDPETSQQAAQRAKRFSPKHEDAIVGVLGIPGTAYDIAQRTGLTHVQVDRRMKALIDEGRVRVLPETRADGPSGAQCRVYDQVTAA